MPIHFLAFVTALTASVSLTPAARRLALALGIVDHPGPRKVHARPMPLLGGVAIYAATVLVTMFMIEGEARWQAVGILTAGSLLLVVGVMDDRGKLHHQVKLQIAMPIAAIILMASDVHSQVFSPPGTPLSDPRIWADFALTFVWVVGITAAFSILDHLDGLCAGVAAVASAFFLYFAIVHGQVFVGTLAAVLLGASIGFLGWNFNPATIFLGDAGAMFLGFMMAAVGLKLRFPELPHATSWMIPVLVLGVPIFDTTLVTISRLRRGLVPFASPGKDHFAHRLVSLGLTHRAAALSIYGFGALAGLAAIAISWLPVAAAYALFAFIALITLAFIAFLERTPYERTARHE